MQQRNKGKYEGFDALTVIFKRNAFYRRQYLLALSSFGLTLIVIGVLISIIIFIIKNPTRPIYFAADNVSRLIRIVPVGQKDMTMQDLFAWAIEAVQNVRSYDYMNYRSQLQTAQKYFTPLGWQTYSVAFNAANNLPGVIADKSIVLARVVGQPTIIKEGLLSGAYAWQLQIPVLVTTWKPPYDDNSKFSNALSDTIIIQRQPVLQSYKGLGIVQLYEQAATAAPNQPQEISGTSTSG